MDSATPYLLLVRHGRTALNAQGRLRGHLDPPLDDIGRAEATATADALAAFAPARVITSPLQRAVQTATAIADRAGLPVLVDDRLIDRDYAAWAGSTPDEVIARWGSLDKAPGVEPASAVLTRAREVLDDEGRRLGTGSAVLVSHDVVNRMLLAWIAPRLGPAAGIGQRTACWNELTRDGGRWQVLRVDQRPSDSPAGGENARRPG